MTVTMQLRQKVRSTMEEIVNKALGGKSGGAVLGSPARPRDFDCYMSAVNSFSENCFDIGKVV